LQRDQPGVLTHLTAATPGGHGWKQWNGAFILIG